MRLKQVLGIAALLLLQSSLYAAGASRLTDVGLQSKDRSTTLTIRATGAFTHTEYRPTDNLLLVDLTGVSAAKMENKSRELHGLFPGIESYHVVGYKGASGAETTRVELTLQHGLLDEASGPVHLTLLAEDEQGYANLCRLITLAHRNTRSWEPGATHIPADDPRRK